MTDVTTIALSKLIPSADNVRRVNSEAGISELAASMSATRPSTATMSFFSPLVPRIDIGAGHTVMGDDSVDHAPGVAHIVMGDDTGNFARKR